MSCLDNCGDGAPDPDEECDDGSAVNGLPCEPTVGGTCAFCNANCQIVEVVYAYPCDADHADCDGVAANGCETRLGTDAHCASCTDVCDQGRACVDGNCTAAGTCSDGRQNQEETGVDCGGKCSPCLTYTRVFYVSSSDPSRSDSNAGTSISAPWETLDRVNAQPLVSGDAVLFKRGDTFRGTLVSSSDGTAGQRIVLAAYGEGARPLILGSKDLSDPGNWTEDATNIWRTAAGISDSGFVGNLIFDNEVSCGIRKTTLGDLSRQGDFFFNEAENGGGPIYLYSVGNPGEHYTQIEAGGVFSENIVRLVSARYFTLSNLDVRYTDSA